MSEICTDPVERFAKSLKKYLDIGISGSGLEKDDKSAATSATSSS